MNKTNFTVPYRATKLVGDYICSTEGYPEILFLHGAGSANRHRFYKLRKKLFEQFNFSSCAFDFLGHGDTGGSIYNTSLKEKTEQATGVIRYKYKEKKTNNYYWLFTSDIGLH